MTLNSNKLESAAQAMLQQAKRLGADQAEVSIDSSKGFSVSVHGGDVETVEYNQDKSIEITVYFGKRRGSASLSDIEPAAISAAVEAACHIARFTDEDPAAGLADKTELAFQYPKLQMGRPWELSVEQAIELAIQCEAEALGIDPRIMVAEDVRVATGEGFSLYANSHDFLGYYPSAHHEISCVLVAKVGDEMQRDYSYTVAANPDDLESVTTVSRQAVERTIGRLGAKQLATMKTPVIFAAEEARGLLGHFLSAITGGKLYRKSSFLLDHLGRQIFPAHIHIQEQPHLKNGLGSAPFDDNGVLTRPNIFIEKGILTSYALDVYSARKLNMQTTGNAGGIHNVMVSHGQKDLSALLQTLDKGLLVTELMGQGINLVTGDYSRGAGGYWVENGKIQFPVSEITIAGNLHDMFARIIEIGNDIDLRGNVRTGSILIEEMTVAGN